MSLLGHHFREEEPRRCEQCSKVPPKLQGIVAKNPEGQVCVFDVKLSLYACIKAKKALIVKALGVRYFKVHIKADYSFYHIKEMIVDGRLHSTANGPYREWLKQQ